MIEQDPILITGIPRSGASVVAKIINACGAFGGTMTNERGGCENDRIRDAIVKSYLNLCGIDIDGQYPLIEQGNWLWIPKDLKVKVESVITKEGYKSGSWMYKDSRLALTSTSWAIAFPNAKWIIVRRRTGDIVQSCMKTAYMSAFKDPKIREAVSVKTEEEGWLWMVHQYELQFVKMIQDGLNCKVIWPERMKRGDYHQLYDTLDWLGLPWKNDVISMINPLILGKQK